nr:hypothetical protein [Tanacetum cinerariifolium]
MAIFIISVSSDSSEEKVGTSIGRVILFESDPSEDPSSDNIPPLPAISPFLSSTDESLDNDVHDTPPSPTHGTPFTETTLSTQRSPKVSGALRCRVMILAPRQPIPHGRPYRYHPNGPTSSDLSTDALSDSASSHSSSDHPSPALPSGTESSHRLCSLVPSIPRLSIVVIERSSHDSSFVSPSRKRSRSPAAFVLLSSPIHEALSSVRVDLLPSPKRIRSPESATDLEVSLAESSEPSRSRGTNLEMDVDVERSDKRHLEPEIDPVKAVIEACFDFSDIIRGSRVDVRVEAVTVARDEVRTDARDMVEGGDD